MVNSAVTQGQLITAAVGNVIVAATVAPTSPFQGQLWMDITASVNRLMVYTGIGWIPVNRPEMALRANNNTEIASSLIGDATYKSIKTFTGLNIPNTSSVLIRFSVRTTTVSSYQRVKVLVNGVELNNNVMTLHGYTGDEANGFCEIELLPQHITGYKGFSQRGITWNTTNGYNFVYKDTAVNNNKFDNLSAVTLTYPITSIDFQMYFETTTTTYTRYLGPIQIYELF